VQFFGELLETLGGGAGHLLGIGVVGRVLDDAEVRTVEQLLEADDVRALSGGVTGELLVLGDHGFLVAGPAGLREGEGDGR
jgi:hypothetical protein